MGVLTLETAHPPIHCSLRSVQECNFFSHAITVPSAHAIEASDASADSAGCLVAPYAEDPVNLSSCPLAGDTIALTNTVTSFLQVRYLAQKSASEIVGLMRHASVDCTGGHTFSRGYVECSHFGVPFLPCMLFTVIASLGAQCPASDQ